MPWNSQLAQVLTICEQARIITAQEYEDIRAVMQEGLDQRTRPANEFAAEQASQIKASDSSQVVSQVKTSGFKFGKASLKELEGVKSELVLLARHALALSTQDFCVYDGLRTIKEQEQHVKNGTSQTMNSKHLKGLAIDLVPWIKGKPVWDWDAIYPIACAVDAAARDLGIESNIRWGGAWDRTLADFHGDPAAYKRVVEEYGARQRALGKSKVFIDGPHFEWVD